MTKYAGLAMTYTLDDSGGSPVAITNDVGSITVDTTVGEQDVTGLDKSAMERLQLLEDSVVTMGGNGFPSSATRAVFNTLTGSRTLAIGWPNSATATVELYLYKYNLSRGQDGGVTWQAEGRLNNGTKLAWS